ncbi:MAG: hypothetical protein HOP29_05840 [Phycisphaerales bacterium]|nr:hypothetical protein [Phycisphaerales bacterium]
MAMKKAELEAHRDAYHKLMSDAQSALRQGLYREALRRAVDSWPYIDGMMQYERRWEEREFKSVEAIDMVLNVAPLLFDFETLNKMEALFAEYRRIDKFASDDLADRLAQARAFMWDAHRMWHHLEQHPHVRQDELRQQLGGDQARWRSIAESWEHMGLVFRERDGASYRVLIATRLGQVVSAKCFACGAIAEAPKAMFLEQIHCSECGRTTWHTIITGNSPSTGGDKQ